MRCTGEYLALDDGLAFVESAGDGVPVLLVHSAGQSGVQWRRTLTALPDHGYRTIVVDLPGHGRSDSPAAGPVRDLAVYRDWCLDVLTRLGAEHPFVVGCSIGGKIALDMAVHASDRLRGVVAMAADARNTRLSVRGLERSLEDAAAPSRTDRTYYGTLAAVGAALPSAHATRIAELHRREDPIVTTNDLVGWATHDLRGQLGRIACPVRLVLGEDDFWIDVDDARVAARNITECRFEVLAGIGHYPMEELHDFPARLAGWLGELSRTA